MHMQDAICSVDDFHKYHEIIENFKDSIIKASQKFVTSCEKVVESEGGAGERGYYLNVSKLSIAAAEEAIQEYWYHRGYE